MSFTQSSYVHYRKPSKGQYSSIEEYVAASIAEYGRPGERVYDDMDLEAGSRKGKVSVTCERCGIVFKTPKTRRYRVCKPCASVATIKCQMCGAVTEKKSSTQLYCPPCSRKKRKQRDHERHQRRRK